MSSLRWLVAMTGVTGLFVWVTYSVAPGNYHKGDTLNESTSSAGPVPSAVNLTESCQTTPQTVTPETLKRAGFEEQDGGYTHPQITVGELKRVLSFQPEDLQEIPNGPPGSPLASVEFRSGGCHLSYEFMLLEPKDSLNDESNKVRVYLWFYQKLQ